MIGEYCKFIEENNLSPFNKLKTPVNGGSDSIYKTKDGKLIHNKFLTKISSNFMFSDSSNLWQCHSFTNNSSEIKRRQEFFRSMHSVDNSFFANLKKPKQVWSPKYEVIAVTENEDTFVRLGELGCTIKFLSSEYDLNDLERYDIVQVIDCDVFERALESLPQSVFINDIEDIYLERYLEMLSAWKENLEVLRHNCKDDEILKIVHELNPLLPFLEERSSKKLNKEEVMRVVDEINEKVEEKIKDITISGGSLMRMLGDKKLPPEFQKIITDAINESGVPDYIFNVSIPVSVDEKELDDLIKRQNATEFTDLAEEIKSKAKILKEIPAKLKRVSELLLVDDFLGGISKYLEGVNSIPIESKDLFIINSKNYFLGNPQPISFNLSGDYRCSILTGANSGGKTTLLEHIIQLISAFQIGLPVNGEVNIPIFEEVYYFAKNKGAANKGAFENLLTQMSEIKPGNRTLILADEIEAVTEPGVAGKIIASTAEYFLNKNCFLIIATHLGYEIKEVLPKHARIDGIEAKGLDAEFNLIVDHNPVIGRLANSTPELIVEKMANIHQTEYFKHLNEKLKGQR
jgi:hypothetical protein